ncbi:MAG: glycosyltransferase family 39 protein, partial [Candidatus Pacearchaeota archaeon]
MTRLKNYLVNKHLLLIFILYFSLRLTNLTLLPIFNDEAIYLDWGWRETHIPGALYYSLYDGKQPLLMWLFGISETIFIDPLFAGRIISVFTGAFTLLGLYLITKILFNKKAAVISALLYIFVPIFMFFDRQALMESAIAAVGVISCYFLVRTADTNAQKYSYWLGIILGIGFFIKSSG